MEEWVKKSDVLELLSLPSDILLDYIYELKGIWINEEGKELEDTGIIGEYVGVPLIEIPALISWLNDQKYINVDETSDDMTEEFEREHQWELSRNCFINNMIRKLEELK